MVNSSFCCSDGDMLIVGERHVDHYGVWQDGGPFWIHLCDARGIRLPCRCQSPSVLEVHLRDIRSALSCPRGVIGANGLANERDFESPVAWYEDRDCDFTCCKYCDEVFTFEQDHSPFDVVAWHGNYHPYRYDLAKFCVVNTVSYDHLDPSIFCVLTSQTGEPVSRRATSLYSHPLDGSGEHLVLRITTQLHEQFMGKHSRDLRSQGEGFLPGGRPCTAAWLAMALRQRCLRRRQMRICSRYSS